MSGREKDGKPLAVSPSGLPASEGERDGDSGGEGFIKSESDKFEILSSSIKENTEALKEAAREIEKANSRFMFQSSTLSLPEETSLMNKVNHIVKYSGIKNRDSTRLVKLLRKEALREPSETKFKDDERNKKRDYFRYVLIKCHLVGHLAAPFRQTQIRVVFP